MAKKISKITLNLEHKVWSLQMEEQRIRVKIQQLTSEKLQQGLLLFLDYLLAKQISEAKTRKTPKFGCAKGTFKMADDFDATLDDI